MAQQTGVETAQLAEIEGLLRSLIETNLPAEAPVPARGRPPILPAYLLWCGLLVCVLRGWSAQRELWRLLASGRFWDAAEIAISDQGLYHRLERDGTAPLEALFVQISQQLAVRLAPLATESLAPFASQIVALDETTLDPVARSLPSLRGQPTEATIPGKLAGVFDVRTQQWQTLQFHPDFRQNEKVLARAMIADLPAESLVLCDLGYFSFEWFDDLTAADLFWVSRVRSKTSFTVEHTFYQAGQVRDALVWLGAHRADRARHLVRLVEFPHGQQLHRYITNVTEPRQFPIAEVARVYARRWDIEMAVKLVKRELQLGLVWSAKSVVIQQQIWAVLTIAQILQALRLEAATQAGVELFDVSMPLLVRYLPRYAAWGHDPIAAFVEDGGKLGFIRPSRRTQIRAPLPDLDDYQWPPPDLVRERTPRYAKRKC